MIVRTVITPIAILLVGIVKLKGTMNVRKVVGTANYTQDYGPGHDVNPTTQREYLRGRWSLTFYTHNVSKTQHDRFVFCGRNANYSPLPALQSSPRSP